MIIKIILHCLHNISVSQDDVLLPFTYSFSPNFLFLFSSVNLNIPLSFFCIHLVPHLLNIPEHAIIVLLTSYMIQSNLV